MSALAIIDYGIGNLLSVSRAFNFIGADVAIVQTPQEISAAQRLVLPGVGAFSDGMHELYKRNLIDAIKEYTAANKPFLGICLGMQLMFTKSHEFGIHDGLNLIAGEVIPIPKHAKDGKPHKIPHIGWNELQKYAPDNQLNYNLGMTPSVYFVHSFMANPEQSSYRLWDTDYNGHSICAAVHKNKLLGCQFHPEKSGEVGLQILKNFMQL